MTETSRAISPSTISGFPLSVFIIAVNEADRIGAVIDAVSGWVDEVIVVDSGSTDDTCAVAERHGARVIYHAWVGYGAQKRFGEEQCRHDWLLNLDADEVVSAELAAEIQGIFASGALPSMDGYILRIADCLPGEDTPPRFAHTTKAVRLYDRRKGRYAESPVHDRVQMQSGEIGELRGLVAHRSIRSITHAIEKLNRYSTMQADDIIRRDKHIRFFGLRLATEMLTAFFKSYILRLDILRGRRGFINAVTYAYSRFVRLVKVWEASVKDR